MRRRDFVTFVGRAAAVWPLVAKIADTADAVTGISAPSPKSKPHSNWPGSD
jgi:hypothetical protein